MRGLRAVMLTAMLCLSPGAASSQTPVDAELKSVVEASPAVAPSPESATPSSAAQSTAPPAEPKPVTAGAAAASSTKGLPRDLSPWGMFTAADIVVKAVMIGLALASMVTWTVWLVKSIELARARRRLHRGIALILAAGDLPEAVRTFEAIDDTSAVLVREAADEARVSAPALDHTDGSGVKERVTSRLSRVEADAGRRMMMGTGLLATIGATAPFVGLFGTVWGIMNSFIGISQAKTTNLAVVAPGIAEAFSRPRIGLVAAIPAVIIYNVFSRAIAGYRALLSDASGEVLQHASRDLERQGRAGVWSAPDATEPAAGPDRSMPRAATLRPVE